MSDLAKKQKTEAAAPAPVPRGLSRRQKAAIIVRVLLSEGGDLDLSRLPEDMQSEITWLMSTMRVVDKFTMDSVVKEFTSQLTSIGVSFPDGLEGALGLLDGKLSDGLIDRIREQAGTPVSLDPWDRLAEMECDELLPVLETESIEIGAVFLSKLKVAKAAELLGMMPGPKARQITFAMSKTGAITPDAVRRIGESLVAQLTTRPETAFTKGPVERVGALLNFSPAQTRDNVLEGLREDDESFADEVTKAIFTFDNIPERMDPRDIPKVIRGVDQADLVTALAFAVANNQQKPADFILENMSKRMSEGLREEMGEIGKIKTKDGDAAMSAVILEIRNLEENGEITLAVDEDDEEE